MCETLKVVRSFSSCDKFLLCAADDLLKWKTIFVTFLTCLIPGRKKDDRNDLLKRRIPCRIEMPFEVVAHALCCEIISRLNLISEKSNFWVYRLTFTFVASLITTYIRLIHGRVAAIHSPSIHEECTRKPERKSVFEENNYIIEARQMVKYFFSMFVLW